jgi:hypothetical protein
LQRSGNPILYEQAASQFPTLYVCPVENVVGSIQLIPYYMMRNKQNTIQHICGMKFHKEQLLIPG